LHRDRRINIGGAGDSADDKSVAAYRGVATN
jgi:hypothetical protein